MLIFAFGSVAAVVAVVAAAAAAYSVVDKVRLVVVGTCSATWCLVLLAPLKILEFSERNVNFSCKIVVVAVSAAY